MPRLKQLSRRIFLGGGASVAVGLPFLEAMLPRTSKAGGTAAAQRLLCIYVPNGMHMQAFTPSQTGSNFTLPQILSPLAELQSEILVLSGITNRPGIPSGGGDHGAGAGAFLTCTQVNKSESDLRNNTSMDQVYADFIGNQTIVPSLQLGIQGNSNTGNGDVGYSCAYERNISWVGSQFLSKVTSPATAFDLLFEGYDPDASSQDIQIRRANKLSVLDHTLADAQKLKARLGAADKRKVDEYLEAVRALEVKVNAAGDGEVSQCGPEGQPGEPANVTEHIDLMGDVMVKAFECDRTRVITFMLADAETGTTYSFLPNVNNGHHNHSHHGGSQNHYDALISIDTWEIERFAVLLSKLKAAQDLDGVSLLDNSMVYLSSEISDGDRHNHDNLPIIVAGRGGGALTPGRHIQYSGDPLANLYIAMLQGLGVNIDRFGDDGTQPLGQLS